jgi:hypothetical protein
VKLTKTEKKSARQFLTGHKELVLEERRSTCPVVLSLFLTSLAKNHVAKERYEIPPYLKEKGQLNISRLATRIHYKSTSHPQNGEND